MSEGGDWGFEGVLREWLYVLAWLLNVYVLRGLSSLVVERDVMVVRMFGRFR